MASETASAVQYLTLVLLVALGAIYVHNQTPHRFDPEISRSILTHLQEVSVSHGGVGLERVALGYNTNLDLVCDAVATLKVLGSPSASSTPEAHPTIENMDQFAETFAHFFQQGSAAERHVDSKEFFDELIETIVHDTDGVQGDGCSFLAGGNAALMANRFASLGVTTVLGGPAGLALRSYLDNDVIVSAPEDVKDEVHLILEHATGDAWPGSHGRFRSPRANRFIVSHDEQNSHLAAAEQLHGYLSSSGFHPEVFVVAGAHLLEGIALEEQETRLSVLRNELSKEAKRGAAIHLELASVGDHEYLKRMAESLLPHADSLGLNEQELGSLYVVLGGTQYTEDDFVSPTTAVATHALEYILQHPLSQEVSRVHLHFLTFHLLCQRQNSESPWNRARAEQAVAAGSLMTTRTACGNEEGVVDPLAVHLLPYSRATEGDQWGTEPISLFAHFSSPKALLEFWVAPVLVCSSPIRTVGLGDSISAAGLAYHVGK